MKYKNFELNSQEDSYLTIVDEDGNEVLCQVLFAFESEELNRKYVIFCEVSEIEKYYGSEDEDEGQIEVSAARYIEGEDGTGVLEEIETEEEWALIEEELADHDGCEEEHCGCGCGHHHEYCCGDECECDEECDCDCECEEDEEEEHCCCCHKHEK